MLAMNVQILRHTEYKNTSTEPPQILLSDLRFYCPTSEFTVRPQNLQYDLRIYSTTSESTVRPQNLQYDLRIYSTTSEFTVRPQSFTVRPGFLEVQILVQPDPAEVYYWSECCDQIKIKMSSLIKKQFLPCVWTQFLPASPKPNLQLWRSAPRCCSLNISACVVVFQRIQTQRVKLRASLA